MMYEIKTWDDCAKIEVPLDVYKTEKQRKALIRHAVRCARKANLIVCNYEGYSSYFYVQFYTQKDKNRFKHMKDMLNSKRSEKVYYASLGRE